jgi:hypothetical protein
MTGNGCDRNRSATLPKFIAIDSIVFIVQGQKMEMKMINANQFGQSVNDVTAFGCRFAKKNVTLMGH